MRTDIHKPSSIIPTDYDFVGYACIKIDSVGDCHIADMNRSQIEAHILHTGGKYSNHEHGGSCHICGASCIYTVVFYHVPTNTYIKTGQDCAEKLDMASSHEAMDAFRTACRASEELKAGKRKAQATLAVEGLEAAWPVYIAEYNGAYEESTIQEMVCKLVKYGSLSGKQFDFMRSLLTRIEGRAAVEAKREADKVAALPMPTGKQIVEGVVISTKSVNSGYGYGDTLKMVVLSDAGWKVYGTIPDSLHSDGQPVKGKRVRFNATIEAAPDDNKFGFFKRPTKAVILEATA